MKHNDFTICIIKGIDGLANPFGAVAINGHFLRTRTVIRYKFAYGLGVRLLILVSTNDVKSQVGCRAIEPALELWFGKLDKGRLVCQNLCEHRLRHILCGLPMGYDSIGRPVDETGVIGIDLVEIELSQSLSP